MQLQAVLTARDVAGALVRLAPIRLHFTPRDDDTRWVELDRPEEAVLVPGEGLRIRASGRLRHTVARVPLEVAIRAIVVTLRPQVVTGSGVSPHLALQIEVEDLDLKNVPGVVDDMLLAAVHQAIQPHATRLTWRFGEQLSHFFELPERLEPIEGLGLRAEGGSCEVNDSGMILRIDFAPLEIVRSRPSPADD